MVELVIKSTLETLIMCSGAMVFGFVFGIPLAVLLIITQAGGLKQHPVLNFVLSALVNALRSIPYIIMMILLLPLTRILVGSSIGTMAALVPLSLAAVLLVAREAQSSMQEVDVGLIEAGKAMGATSAMIIRKVLLGESWPATMSGITTVAINIIGYSAMAGAVGGGGLGDLAIRYGYQRYDLQLLAVIIIILIVMVQIVQMLGDYWVRALKK